MKLLFDENLAPGLVADLAELYPGSNHVRELGLERADDTIIWLRAAQTGYAIVSKDDDFRQRSFLFGAPPKVIWVTLGNCKTADVARLLRERRMDVIDFGADPVAALLVLGRARETGGSPSDQG